MDKIGMTLILTDK